MYSDVHKEFIEWMEQKQREAEAMAASFTSADLTTAIQVVCTIGRVMTAKHGPDGATAWVDVANDLHKRLTRQTS